jgi:type IV fimbrial biogenesis protein FimT
MPRNRGLTLIELIIILTVLALLITLGAPSLRNMYLRNEQTVAVNSFLNHFFLARSLAIQRQKHEIICPSEDGLICLENGIWSRGLIIFEDSGRNGVLDPADPIHSHYLLPESSQLEVYSSQHRTRVIYHEDGRPSGYNLTLTFCDPEERIKPKALIVNNVGRIRISDTGPDNLPLNCNN